MKHEVRDITSSQWLNIINQEADPDVNVYQVTCYKIDGKQYAVHLLSGLGSFISDLFDGKGAKIDKEMEKRIEKVEEEYKAKKAFLAPFSGFLAGLQKPGI